MWFRVLLAFVCWAAVAAPAPAQSKASQVIEGVVRDSTGAVLVSAGVVLTREDGSDPLTTVTDGAGRFEFHAAPGKTYRIAASAAGFAESARLIEVGGDQPFTVDLVLQLVVTDHVEVTQNVLTSTLGLNGDDHRRRTRCASRRPGRAAAARARTGWRDRQSRAGRGHHRRVPRAALAAAETGDPGRQDFVELVRAGVRRAGTGTRRHHHQARRRARPRRHQRQLRR